MREKLLALITQWEAEAKEYYDTCNYEPGSCMAVCAKQLREVLNSDQYPTADTAIPAIPVFDERGRKC